MQELPSLRQVLLGCSRAWEQPSFWEGPRNFARLTTFREKKVQSLPLKEGWACPGISLQPRSSSLKASNGILGVHYPLPIL